MCWTGCLATSGGSGWPTTVTAPLWVRGVLGLIGAAVVLTSAYLLFRAPRDTRTLDAVDEAKVRTLLRDFGDHDSLGYFATRRDKSIVWDTGAPGYRQSRGVFPGRRVGQPGQW